MGNVEVKHYLIKCSMEVLEVYVNLIFFHLTKKNSKDVFWFIENFSLL